MKFSNDGELSECSNKGRCNRENGLCECLEGYSGDACQMHNCPSSGDTVCSGHGICVTEYEYKTDHMKSCNNNNDKINCKNVDITNEIDLKRNNICICQSGYSEYDCSIKDCPYGLAGTVENKKKYYGESVDITKNPSSSSSPPPTEIANYDIVTIGYPKSNFDLEIVRCNKKMDSNPISCRYEKINLNPIEEVNGIRTKLIVYHIICFINLYILE